MSIRRERVGTNDLNAIKRRIQLTHTENDPSCYCMMCVAQRNNKMCLHLALNGAWVCATCGEYIDPQAEECDCSCHVDYP